MITKEECNNALDRVARFCSFYAPYKDAEHLKLNGELDVLYHLIEEHFDNPPLTIDDLRMDQEVYCESYGETVLILGVDKEENSLLLSMFDRRGYFECEFEPDTFYRRKL